MKRVTTIRTINIVSEVFNTMRIAKLSCPAVHSYNCMRKFVPENSQVFFSVCTLLVLCAAVGTGPEHEQKQIIYN